MNDLSSHCKEFIEDIWNNYQLDRLSDYICNDYTLYHHPGDPWNGKTLNRTSFEQRVTYYRESVPDLHFSIQELQNCSTNVLVCWIMTGTHTGNHPIAATGKRIKITGMTLFYLQDNRIRGHWQEQDSLGYYNQLNIV